MIYIHKLYITLQKNQSLNQQNFLLWTKHCWKNAFYASFAWSAQYESTIERSCLHVSSQNYSVDFNETWYWGL